MHIQNLFRRQLLQRNFTPEPSVALEAVFKPLYLPRIPEFHPMHLKIRQDHFQGFLRD